MCHTARTDTPPAGGRGRLLQTRAQHDLASFRPPPDSPPARRPVARQPERLAALPSPPAASYVPCALTHRTFASSSPHGGSDVAWYRPALLDLGLLAASTGPVPDPCGLVTDGEVTAAEAIGDAGAGEEVATTTNRSARPWARRTASARRARCQAPIDAHEVDEPGGRDDRVAERRRCLRVARFDRREVTGEGTPREDLAMGARGGSVRPFPFYLP